MADLLASEHGKCKISKGPSPEGGLGIVTCNLTSQYLYRNELRQDEGKVESYGQSLWEIVYKPSSKTEGKYYKT